jgi:hypothetical protein
LCDGCILAVCLYGLVELGGRRSFLLREMGSKLGGETVRGEE